MKQMADPKEPASGWQIRCLKCDFTERWIRNGIRLKADGRGYAFGRCPQCKRIRLRVVEKVPSSKL